MSFRKNPSALNQQESINKNFNPDQHHNWRRKNSQPPEGWQKFKEFLTGWLSIWYQSHVVILRQFLKFNPKN